MSVVDPDHPWRPAPMLETDHVQVYAQDLQLNLTVPQHGDKPFLGTRQDFGGGATATMKSAATTSAAANRMLYPPPLLSPGPPLRGYAAEPLRPPAKPGKGASRSPSPAERMQLQAAADEQYQQMMQAILERTRQQNQTQQQDEDRRMERLLKHIQSEQGFVEDLDRSLQLHDQMKFREKQQLYRDWDEKVYKVIQKQIDEQMSKLSMQQITERRRKLLEDYIRVSNRKRYGLYRDIIIESEYDPMVAHKTLIKYKIRDSQDPLKIELNQLAEKQQSPAAKGAANSQPFDAASKRELGRATLAPTMWARLDATPYGRFDRVPAGQPYVEGQSPRSLSRVNMEHYNVEIGRDVLDREFPRGKRMTIDGVRDHRKSKIFDALPPPPPMSLMEEWADEIS